MHSTHSTVWASGACTDTARTRRDEPGTPPVAEVRRQWKYRPMNELPMLGVNSELPEGLVSWSVAGDATDFCGLA